MLHRFTCNYRQIFTISTGFMASHLVFIFRYYNWSTAAPLMLAMQAFQKPLPKVRNSEAAQTFVFTYRPELWLPPPAAAGTAVAKAWAQ